MILNHNFHEEGHELVPETLVAFGYLQPRKDVVIYVIDDKPTAK